MREMVRGRGGKDHYAQLKVKRKTLCRVLEQLFEQQLSCWYTSLTPYDCWRMIYEAAAEKGKIYSYQVLILIIFMSFTWLLGIVWASQNYNLMQWKKELMVTKNSGLSASECILRERTLSVSLTALVQWRDASLSLSGKTSIILNNVF